jgi:hypothetical protein
MSRSINRNNIKSVPELDQIVEQSETHLFPDKTRQYQIRTTTTHNTLPPNPTMSKVKLTTTHDPLLIQLFPSSAPKTVANFLAYVKAGFYDNTLLHAAQLRVMVQGGRYAPGLKPKEATRAAIANEAGGRPNLFGTVAETPTLTLNVR